MLRIDTFTVPYYYTTLNPKEIEDIQKRMNDLFDYQVANQYNIIYECLLSMKDQFENDADDLAIKTMITAMQEGYFKGKKCSQPSHFQNLILHIIERSTSIK